jgi:hypothetical protein
MVSWQIQRGAAGSENASRFAAGRNRDLPLERLALWSGAHRLFRASQVIRSYFLIKHKPTQAALGLLHGLR